VGSTTHSFKNITHKANKNLWIFRKNAEKEIKDIKFDEATIERVLDPRADFVKPGKEKIVIYCLKTKIIQNSRLAIGY